MAPKLDYEGIKDLAEELGRPIETLVALNYINDPFYVTPARTRDAEWFLEIRNRLGIPNGYHKRRIHYLLISQPKPALMPNGKPYENTLDCFEFLCRSTKDAIFLGFISENSFIDNRSDEPIIRLIDQEDARINLYNSLRYTGAPIMPTLPELILSRPTVPQPYHIEIWAEKSTMNDILVPLANRFKLNLITAPGEMTATSCINLVNRAKRSGRPVRILYVSDFDPAGQSMPVAVARKIEFELHRRGLSLDVQVRPIALTHEQCKEYELPRTPLKKSERRAGAFEDRFDEGATELDALEALNPGLLRRIVKEEIDRYWNPDHDDIVSDYYLDVENQLEEIASEIHAKHQGEINVLTTEWREIAKAQRAWFERAKPIWQAINDELEEVAPDIDDDWCPGFDADEDPDPLFDSSRGYIEQIDRYKRHQGRPTERVLRQAVCVICGTTYEGIRKDRKYCGEVCRRKASQDTTRPKLATCAICGTSFEARRKDSFLCGSPACKRAHGRENEAAYRERERQKSEALRTHGMPNEEPDRGSDGAAS